MVEVMGENVASLVLDPLKTPSHRVHLVTQGLPHWETTVPAVGKPADDYSPSQRATLVEAVLFCRAFG